MGDVDVVSLVVAVDVGDVVVVGLVVVVAVVLVVAVVEVVGLESNKECVK